MNEKQLHSGWLKTREQEKFAPKTLIDNIYTSTGELYKTENEAAIANIISSINNLDYEKQIPADQVITSITQTNGLIDVQHSDIDLPNIDYSDADTLFIIDAQERIIAYIDNNGIHTTDIEANNLFIQQNAVVTGDLAAHDTILNSLVVDRSETIGGNLNVAGNTSVSGTLEITDTATFHNGIDIPADVFYIIDENENVLALFNGNGLLITNVTTKGIYRDGNNEYHVYSGQNGISPQEISINACLVELLNRLATAEANITTSSGDISTIEQRLANVTNVMDFIGSFNTEASLFAYQNPNNGDVAVVLENGKEYIYDSTLNNGLGNWVEFGNSTSTSSAIADHESRLTSVEGLITNHGTRLTTAEGLLTHIQSVIGHPEAMQQNEETHETRLTAAEGSISNHGTRLTAAEGSITNHGTRLDNLEDVDILLKRIINYKGIIDVNGVYDDGDIGLNAQQQLCRYQLTGHNSSTGNAEYNWVPYPGIGAISAYLDAQSSDAFYLLDSDNNVIFRVYENGIHTTGGLFESNLTVTNTKGSGTIDAASNISSGGNITAAANLVAGNNLTVMGVTTFGNEVSPSITNTINLGSNNKKWVNVYATTFNGDLSGNATTATNLAGTITKNYVYAGPQTGSAAAPPSFRALVAADIPDLSSIYLTSFTETDPTVPAWAKAENKPTYTASEIGLGNVTNHQQVHDVTWDSANKKITRSKNGTPNDVVSFVAGTGISLTAAAGSLTVENTGVTGIKGNAESNYRTGQVVISKSDIGLGNVEDTALSAWIGSSNITTIGTLSSGTVPWARLSDIPNNFTPSSHTHGNIQNNGTLQTNDITIATGDQIVVTDSSDNNKIARTSIAFDGSTETSVLSKKGTWVALPTVESLGLSNAMHFKGITTTVMTDNLSTQTIVINGNNYTAAAGDVVLYDDSEYVWTGIAWERLGRDSSFKVTQTAITDNTGTEENTAATRFIYSFSQDVDGVVSVKTRPLGNAPTATAANITTIQNALAYYSDTNGTFTDSEIVIIPSSKHIGGWINGGQKTGTTLGSYATTEGYDTTASGNYSHAEGHNTIASGNYSHAEGFHTAASGNYSHAEGFYTAASGDQSHTEGYSTAASGNYSHAEGFYTTAQRKSQHVFGEYNILDTTGANGTVRGSYVEIVGNGTSTSSSNARTLDWDGNESLAGNLLPMVTDTKDLGSSSLKWANVYATNFNGIASSATAANISTAANRIAYYSDATGRFSYATGHYINDNKLALNSISEPTETLFVNGTVKVTGNTTLQGTLDVTSTLTTASTASIGGNLTINGGLIINDTGNPNTLYLTDNQENVFAYFDNNGLHVTNIDIPGKNLLFFTDISSTITINF